MNKLATFGMYPWNFAFRVFDANVDEGETYHEVTDRTLAQGFSARPGSLTFSVFGECHYITIEVYTPEPLEEISVRPETVRAILLPFSVDGKGIKIADITGSVEEWADIKEGNYALLFELKLRDDIEYLNSPQYHENVEDGWTEECCRLTFYPREDAVRPEILRQDAWSDPPYHFHSYSPLNPTYPLLMEIGLA